MVKCIDCKFGGYVGITNANCYECEDKSNWEAKEKLPEPKCICKTIGVWRECPIHPNQPTEKASGGEKLRVNEVSGQSSVNRPNSGDDSKLPETEPEKVIGKSNQYYKGHEDATKELIEEFIKVLRKVKVAIECKHGWNSVNYHINKCEGRLK